MQNRYLANYTIFESKVYRQCIWSFDGDNVTYERFDTETPNTVFIDGILIIGNENLFHQEHIDGIKAIIEGDNEVLYASLCQYMDEYNLSCKRNDAIGVIEVKIATKEIIKVEIKQQSIIK